MTNIKKDFGKLVCSLNFYERGLDVTAQKEEEVLQITKIENLPVLLTSNIAFDVISIIDGNIHGLSDDDRQQLLFVATDMQEGGIIHPFLAAFNLIKKKYAKNTEDIPGYV